MKFLFLLGLFLLANIVPVLGAHFGFWSSGWLVYYYWAVCAVIGGFSLLIYAKHLLVFFILLGLVFGLFSLIDLPFWSDLRLPMTFWTLYSLSWLFYFELNKSTAGLQLKRLSPLQHFTFYLVYMGLAVAGCFALSATIYGAWDTVEQMPFKVMMLFIGAAALIPTFMIGMLRVIDMVGPRHFIHFLIGTYHRPIEKERVVLFMDMVGSSTLAEQMRPKKSMALIAQFIFDAGAMFRMHGGDILNYTGDGLVVLWDTKHADKALHAVEALQSRLEKRTPAYIKEFKVVPEFRIGIHAGDVVISQIGEEKLFLGLYGDTVNTSARLEGMNKDLDTQVLFSKAVQQRLSPQMKERAAALGLKNVKGRKERIEVFTLKTGEPVEGERKKRHVPNLR